MFDINEYLDWIGEKFDSIINSLIETTWIGFIYLVELIPAPNFLLNLGTLNIPSNVTYFANWLEIPAGIAIVTSAYLARFILRRIPVIG